MAIKVSRRGKLAESWTRQNLGEARVGVAYGGAYIAFGEQKGFGASIYELRIEATSYGDLVEAMMRADSVEAIKAFAAALKDGVPAPAPRDGLWRAGQEKKPPEAA